MINSITIPRPLELKFTEWGALAAEQLVRYGVAEPLSEDSWKSWVCVLFYIPELDAKNIPSPDLYPRWQDWAEIFVESVR